MTDERATGNMSFDEFCVASYERVARVAFLVTSDEQEALDIAQETFTRAFMRWDTVSQAASQEAWAVRVATNLAVTHLRWRRVRRRDTHVEPDHSTDDQSAVEFLEVLRELTPAQRTVVVLRYFLDWSVEETAEALHKRPGTVRALTSQAFGRLRHSITVPEEEYVD